MGGFIQPIFFAVGEWVAAIRRGLWGYRDPPRLVEDAWRVGNG
jgi:hypothetical protein